MRATEIKKHAAQFGNNDRGRILMAIDGSEVEVRKVQAALDAEFTNTSCEEEGDNEGEISISYMIDRNEKKDFMFAYTTAKRAV